MKKLFIVLVCLVAMSGIPAMAKTKTLNDAVAAAKSAHLIDGYDCVDHKAYINELAWYTTNYSNKEMLAQLLATYCKERGGQNLEMHLYGNHTGHELGGIDWWGNMYVK